MSAASAVLAGAGTSTWCSPPPFQRSSQAGPLGPKIVLDLCSTLASCADISRKRHALGGHQGDDERVSQLVAEASSTPIEMVPSAVTAKEIVIVLSFRTNGSSPPAALATAARIVSMASTRTSSRAPSRVSARSFSPGGGEVGGRVVAVRVRERFPR